MAQRPRLAVLIDGENISAERVEFLFGRIRTLGSIVVSRVYGAPGQLQGWDKVQAQYKIKSRKNEPLKRKRDIADVTLAIDALRLLHEREVDAFCIVSSDGGFAALARYIRDRSKRVYGFGEPKAPQCLRNACCGKYTDL